MKPHLLSLAVSLCFPPYLLAAVEQPRQNVIANGKNGVAIGENNGNVTINTPKDPRTDGVVQLLLKELEAKNKALADKDKLLRDKDQAVLDLTKTVNAVLSQANVPNAPNAEKQAATALAQGDITGAANLLGQEATRQASEADAKRHKAAQLFRQQGQLLRYTNAIAALSAFEQAVKAEPEEVRNYVVASQLATIVGDLVKAADYAQKALQITEDNSRLSPNNYWYLSGLSSGYDLLGDIYAKQANIKKAVFFYQESLQVAKRLAHLDYENKTWHSHLAFSYNKLGDFFAKQEAFSMALKHYENSLKIHQQLVISNKRYAQYDLLLTYERIGDVLVNQGNLQAAWECYQHILQTLQVLESLQEPDGKWQIYLPNIYERLGYVLFVQGHLPAALGYYEKGLQVAQQLVALDGKNRQWQRDLSVSYERLGDVLVAQRNLPAALDYYEKSLRVRQQLVALDASSQEAQTDLVVSYAKLGGLPPAAGLTVAVRRDYLSRGLEIVRRLEAEQRLFPSQKKWIEAFENGLAALALEN